MTTCSFDLTGKGALVRDRRAASPTRLPKLWRALGANEIIPSRKQQACDEVASETNARGAGRATFTHANIGTKAHIERLLAEPNDMTAGGV